MPSTAMHPLSTSSHIPPISSPTLRPSHHPRSSLSARLEDFSVAPRPAPRPPPTERFNRAHPTALPRQVLPPKMQYVASAAPRPTSAPFASYLPHVYPNRPSAAPQRVLETSQVSIASLGKAAKVLGMEVRGVTPLRGNNGPQRRGSAGGSGEANVLRKPRRVGGRSMDSGKEGGSGGGRGPVEEFLMREYGVPQSQIKTPLTPVSPPPTPRSCTDSESPPSLNPFSFESYLFPTPPPRLPSASNSSFLSPPPSPALERHRGPLPSPPLSPPSSFPAYLRNPSIASSHTRIKQRADTTAKLEGVSIKEWRTKAQKEEHRRSDPFFEWSDRDEEDEQSGASSYVTAGGEAGGRGKGVGDVSFLSFD